MVTKSFSLSLATFIMLCWVAALPANANPVWTISQVTNSIVGESGEPVISGNGNRISFTSTANLTGANADNSSEIFLFDVKAGTLIQIAEGTGIHGSEGPSINQDGTIITFESSYNLTGQNADNNREIFVFNFDTGLMTQITNTPEKGIVPSISADGTRIAFGLIGGDNINRIALFDMTTSMLNPLGILSAFNVPAISDDGSRIAFTSKTDLAGANADHSSEIFLFDVKTGTLTQITEGPGIGDGSEDPSINQDGTIIAFESMDNLTGQNPDNNDEVFLFNVTTGKLMQITDTTTESGSDPSISADGKRFAFEFTGANGKDEIRLFDALTGLFTRITDSLLGDSFEPDINSDGTLIVFASDADLTGGNPDHSQEIFLARQAEQAVPAPGTLWLLGPALLALYGERRVHSTRLAQRCSRPRLRR